METKILAIFLMVIAHSSAMPAKELKEIEDEIIALLADKRQSGSNEEFGDTLDFQCDNGNWVNRVTCFHGDHDNRRWSVECTSHGLGDAYMQSTSDFINDESQLMGYQCPDNGFITGLYSTHENDDEHENEHENEHDMDSDMSGDLSWKVTCTSVQGKCPTNCQYSDPNGWNDSVDFTAPTGMGLRGMVSAHMVTQEDSSYFWETCKYIDC